MAEAQLACTYTAVEHCEGSGRSLLARARGVEESSWGDGMPESLENQKPPLYMTASTKVPSLDEVTACHVGAYVPGEVPPDGVVPVTSVQVAPVSVE